MARPATTPAKARATVREHLLASIAASQRALAVLDSASNPHVCGCPDGNAEGITEAECGCAFREAAKVHEASGCYTRRAESKGLLA